MPSGMLETACFDLPRCRNIRFAFASGEVVLVLGGAVGRCGLAAADALRFSDSRMPCVGIGARLELSVRELTPIQEISEDSRPYSIFGQRFITTLMPAASAFAAAASLRTPSCIQITFGGGTSCSASSTTGMMWLELRKMSTMSIGTADIASDATKGFPSRLLPTWPGLTGIMS